MLAEIPRFHRRARAVLTPASTAGDAYDAAEDQTLRAFLDEGGFSAHFVRHFMEPLVAAVWSCDPATSLDYPARYLFTFLEHHGMLGIFGSPEWRTVTGGSRRPTSPPSPSTCRTIRLGTKVTSVRETADGVEVTDGNGDDHVVRRRGGRHPPVAGAEHARGADPAPARGPRRDALLAQHRAAAHRHLAAARARRAPARRGTSSARSTRPARSP